MFEVRITSLRHAQRTHYDPDELAQRLGDRDRLMARALDEFEAVLTLRLQDLLRPPADEPGADCVCCGYESRPDPGEPQFRARCRVRLDQRRCPRCGHVNRYHRPSRSRRSHPTSMGDKAA